MNERLDSDAIAREGSDATPWSSGVGARRVTVRTPGLRLGLLLFAAGLLWYGILLTEPARDLPRHAWVMIETRGRLIAGLASTADGARPVSADHLGGTNRADTDACPTEYAIPCPRSVNPRRYSYSAFSFCTDRIVGPDSHIGTSFTGVALMKIAPLFPGQVSA